jgi:hypothetical protein
MTCRITNRTRSGSVSLAMSILVGILATAGQPANGQPRRIEGLWLSQAPTNKLEKMLREKGFIVLVLDSFKADNAPLLNVDATYSDTNSNGLMENGDRGFFNPASTIKVMIAGQTLEVIHKNGWQRNATYQADKSDKKYSFAKDIEAMLVVSDNAATNRLIQFLGFKNIASRAKLLGLSNFELNRLMLSKGPAVGSPSYTVISSGVSHVIPAKAAPSSTDVIRCRETATVKGNCATANDLVMSLRLLLDSKANTGLDIAPEDRQWVAGVMGSTPKQRGFDEPDEYCRFIQPLTTDATVGMTSLRSKCGVAPFTPTFLDLSRVTTKNNRSFDMLLVKKYDSNVSEESVVKEFSSVAREILLSLK